MICNQPTSLWSTKNPGLFNTYKEGLIMHTGRRNPFQLLEDEQIDNFSNQPTSYLENSSILSNQTPLSCFELLY